MPDKDTLMRGFQMGPWTVLPERGLLRNGDDEKRIEPLVMDVLVALAVGDGDVVSKDQLVQAAWGGRPVTDDVIVHSIAGLRKSLGDNARDPDYVENIPRRGYRLKMPVIVKSDGKAGPKAALDPPGHPPRPGYYLPLLAGFAAVIGIAIFRSFIPDSQPLDDGAPSLAIFPLECAEADKILCYSVSEELISRLLNAQDIKVVRSRDAFPQDPAEETIADVLRVNDVFIGELMRSGDELYIKASIQGRRDGSLSWNESYEGKLDDLVNIRSRLADDVVTAMIGETAEAAEAASRPQSFEALDAYTTGQYEFSIRSAGSIRRAIELFEQTIELDPNFGPAYVHLAYAYALLPEYTAESQNLMYEKALQNADRAVAVDRSVYGPAQTVYGFIHHKRTQWTRATKAHIQAINSSTVYPLSHQLYSRLLASVGRLDASLVEAQKAYEIDPQQAVLISRLAMAYFWLDDLDNAEIYFARSNAHKEYEAGVHDFAYSLFLVRKGDYDSAAIEASAGLEKAGLDSSWVQEVFEGMHNPEKYDEAHRIVEQLSAGGHLVANAEISLWVLLDDGERAMSVARRLQDSGEIFEAELMFIPQFAVLREHPDFPDLLDAIGMTEYWASIGCTWQGDFVECDNDVSSRGMH
jgi:DNA-binding winged helix-turn-helix (wHTH) protein/TolB-like protein/Tfp pilus assembly protein PilF